MRLLEEVVIIHECHGQTMRLGNLEMNRAYVEKGDIKESQST